MIFYGIIKKIKLKIKFKWIDKKLTLMTDEIIRSRNSFLNIFFHACHKINDSGIYVYTVYFINNHSDQDHNKQLLIKVLNEKY